VTAGPDLTRTLPGSPVPPWPGEQVRLGGRTLFVRRTGPEQGPAGEAAVLVHGLGGASTNWTDVMYLLGDRFDCWAPDLPGFGRSEPPPGDNYSLDSHAMAIVRLCEYVAAGAGGPVHLFGNSLGGAAVVQVAASRPDLVRSLTLVSPAMPVIRPRRGTDARLLFLLLPGISGLVMRSARNQTARARVQAVLDLCYVNPSAVPEERIAEATAEMERRRGLAWFDTAMMASLRGLAGSYFRRGERTLWRQATSVEAPTLVIWGRQDRLVSVSIAGRTQQSIPGSRLVVLDDCGHVAQLEHPLRVAREFLALIRG
jgi:pimeloyl-ACP methyl ester carboxylesterase